MTELGQMPGDARKRITDSPPPTREPIRLTDEEREALWQSGEVSIINCDHDSNLVAAVESILAARLAGGPTLADAYKDGWIQSAVHHATCGGCGVGVLRHTIPTPYRTPESEDTE